MFKGKYSVWNPHLVIPDSSRIPWIMLLKQTNYVELTHIFECIKTKEAFVHQEEIKVYIESGKELKVKHLVSELKEIDKNVT